MIRTKIAAAAVAVALIGFGSAAFATPVTIGLQEAGYKNGNITQVATGDPTAGYTSNYGSFTFNGVSGFAFDSSSNFTYATNSLNAASSNGGVLTVYLTTQDLSFADLPGMQNFKSSFTQNALSPGWTVGEATYIDFSNGLFDTSTPLGSKMFSSIGTDIVNSSVNVTSQPFSITAVYTISAIGRGSANSTINVSAAHPVAVPEPGDLGMMGLGLFVLAGLGMAARRRKHRGDEMDGGAAA